MFKGVAFALGACLIWGLIFVVPQFMGEFSFIEVVLGRYVFYGTLSSLIFFKFKLQGTCQHPQSIWIKALGFSLVATFGYYSCLVLSLQYASPAICALILGVSPITIAFYGNWRQKEISYKKLVVPSLLILVGLVIINIPYFERSSSPSSYLLGLMFSGISLSAWTWYVVANARFLKEHPQVSSSDWSTLIGVTTVFWVILFSAILSIYFEDHLHTEKYFVLNHEWARFLIGSAILGLVCSWVGAYLWNQASLRLPVSLAGQLTVFETIFGVVFVYLINQSLPSIVESVGITILLIAIAYGLSTFAKHAPVDAPQTISQEVS